jgi:hypothetical protein
LTPFVIFAFDGFILLGNGHCIRVDVVGGSVYVYVVLMAPSILVIVGSVCVDVVLMAPSILMIRNSP